MAASNYKLNITKPGKPSITATSDNASDVLGDGTVSCNASTNALELKNTVLESIMYYGADDQNRNRSSCAGAPVLRCQAFRSMPA